MTKAGAVPGMTAFSITEAAKVVVRCRLVKYVVLLNIGNRCRRYCKVIVIASVN